LKNSTRKAPPGLSANARAWWRRLTDEYAINDSGGLLLLQSALESFDRMNQAKELIAKHGAVTVDRFQQLRPNPATTIERDSRAAMLSALKALNLDLEPLRDAAGRPPGR
jgi:P27 family predicted phage terminase small subunit